MVSFECYFDESYGNDDHQLLVVAGYLFEKNDACDLDLRWKDALSRYKDLPYFHMVDCAHHNKPFDRLSKLECDAIAREMIGHIRAQATFGVAVGISQIDYNVLFPESEWRPMGDPYSYCCWTALAAIHGWITRNQVGGEIAYYFEAGHSSQIKANAIMKQIFDRHSLRFEYRYAGHGFRQKERMRPLQTADILAWHHYQDIKRMLANKPRRKDFAALIEDRPMELKFINRKSLQTMKHQTDDLRDGYPQLGGVIGNFSPFVATWIRDRL